MVLAGCKDVDTIMVRVLYCVHTICQPKLTSRCMLDCTCTPEGRE